MMNTARDIRTVRSETVQPTLRLVSTTSVRRHRKARRNSVLRAIERALFAAAVVGVLWLGASSVVENIFSNASRGQQGSAEVTVGPGDTIWQIAGKFTGADEQQESTVNQIRTLNSSLREDSRLQVGQKIRVPIPGTPTEETIHLANAGQYGGLFDHSWLILGSSEIAV